MAETISPYTYSGFLDHVYSSDDKEIVTLSVSKCCNFKSQKSLEERQSLISRVREEDPHKIPVLIVTKNCGTTMQKLPFFVESKINIGDLFTMSVKKICRLNDISNMTHQGPTAGKLMSSIYDEHKDEDGCLYMTLSGPFPKGFSSFLIMEETISPYTYSGFLDHVYTTDDKGIVTLSVSKCCNFKPEKPLEERQAIISRVREKDPHKIPVVIVTKNTGSSERMLSLFVESKINIGDLFTMSVKQICKLKDISNMTHQGPTAGKLMSSIYDEHKDEDGCLYMTLSGAFPKLVVDALRRQCNQNIVQYVELLREIHSLQEEVPKRRHTGRLGSILSFIWRLSTWKRS